MLGKTKTKLTSLLFSFFTFLRSFLLSYYFFILYFMVSLYYILKLLSFLSHVFVAASILLIAFLLSLTNNISTQCSKNELGFLLASHVVLGKIIPMIDKGDEESYPLEALDLYKFVFETYMIDEIDRNVENSEDHPEEKILQAVESSILEISQNNQEEYAKSKDGILASSLKEDSTDDEGQLKIPNYEVKEKRLEEFFKEVDEYELMDCRGVGKSLDKEKTETNMVKTESIKKRHSRKQSVRTSIDFCENGGGRMSRKEKDWKKSLACKLFEEKPSNSVEDMDLLWETYEEKTSTGNSRNDEMNNENEGPEKKIIYDFEDEEEIDVHVSCLHAFKFSGGKMNMGVGGRNLVRISKVVKGIRWLRSVTKHGRRMSDK